MTVDPNTAAAYDHAGGTYRFRSDGCRDTFTTNPHHHLPGHSTPDAA